MSDSSKLQRRYRRLLAFYPRSFRRERGEEILSVLMSTAAANQRRPGVAESADLVANGVSMRLRRTKIPSDFERRHAAFWIWVRMLSGIWVLIITGILCQIHQWWALALLPAAALHFFIAYRLGLPAIRREREQGRGGTQPPAAAGQ